MIISGQKASRVQGFFLRQRTVTWKGRGELSELAGKPVRLRFALKEAKLYSFVFSF